MDVWDYWFFGCFMALCAVGCATWAIIGDHERRAREDADGRQLARERQAGVEGEWHVGPGSPAPMGPARRQVTLLPSYKWVVLFGVLCGFLAFCSLMSSCFVYCGAAGHCQ